MNTISTEHLALLIPIIAILFVGLVPSFFFLLKYLRRRHLFELYHQERMAAIAKGIEIPMLPEALLRDSNSPKVWYPGRTLLKGLIWLFVGVGVFVALQQQDRREAVFAAIPVALGLAYLIYYLIEGRKALMEVPNPIDPDPPLPASAKL